MKPSEILAKARELLSDPKRWTQGALSRNALGEWAEDELVPESCQWCVEGAYRQAHPNNRPSMKCDQGWAYLLAAIGGDKTIPPYEWNDSPSRTHAEVLDALERAEQLAIGAGQ